MANDAAVPYQNPTTVSSNLDAESATTAEGVVLRERIVIAGPQTNDDGHTFNSEPGTALQLPSHECRYVIVTASQANQDVVVIGGPNVIAGSSLDSSHNRKGIPLFANQNITIACNNTNQLWIDVVSAGDGISWSYFV